jgi:hypothetical protein
VLSDETARAKYDVILGDGVIDEGASYDAPPNTDNSFSECYVIDGAQFKIEVQHAVVREHQEWSEPVSTWKEDHRPFVGRGRYLDVKQVPKQKIWLRTAKGDTCIRPKAGVLAVAAGHRVALYAAQRPLQVKADMPFLLVNHDSGDCCVLEESTTVAQHLLTAGQQAKDMLSLVAANMLGLVALYFICLQHAGLLLWMAGLLLGPIIIFNIVCVPVQRNLLRMDRAVRDALRKDGIVYG